jgi:hypothetical protein
MPEVETNRSILCRNSYSEIIWSLTTAATLSDGPVSDCKIAPGAGGGVAGNVAAGEAPDAGATAPRASAGAAFSAKAMPKTAQYPCISVKVRPFGSNPNGLRARPRTGPENKQNRPRFKDGRTRLAETS